MRIRAVQSAEVDLVADFAIEGMRAESVPMVVSREKVVAVIEHFVRPNRDFNLLAWDGDTLVAGIAVAVSEMLWFERCEAHIIMFRSLKPGVGRTLMRHALGWCASDMRIQRVLWSLEADANARTTRYASRYGFNAQALCVWHKE